MKSPLTPIFITILLLITLSANAQKQTDGFWGIPFRASKQEAINITKSKNLKPIEQNEQHLTFIDVTFGGETVDKIMLVFLDNQFMTSFVGINSSSTAYLMKSYDNWKQKLIEKYGAPTQKKEEYPLYVSSKDDYTMLEHALKEGEATFSCFWILTDAGTHNTSIISLKISDTQFLQITFADNTLLDKSAKQRKNQDQKDY